MYLFDCLKFKEKLWCFDILRILSQTYCITYDQQNFLFRYLTKYYTLVFSLLFHTNLIRVLISPKNLTLVSSQKAMLSSTNLNQYIYQYTIFLSYLLKIARKRFRFPIIKSSSYDAIFIIMITYNSKQKLNSFVGSISAGDH